MLLFIYSTLSTFFHGIISYALNLWKPENKVCHQEQQQNTTSDKTACSSVVVDFPLQLAENNYAIEGQNLQPNGACSLQLNNTQVEQEFSSLVCNECVLNIPEEFISKFCTINVFETCTNFPIVQPTICTCQNGSLQSSPETKRYLRVPFVQLKLFDMFIQMLSPKSSPVRSKFRLPLFQLYMQSRGDFNSQCMSPFPGNW